MIRIVTSLSGWCVSAEVSCFKNDKITIDGKMQNVSNMYSKQYVNQDMLY